MKFQTKENLAVAGIIAGIVGYLAVIGLVVYVAAHFIIKFW